MQQIINLLCMKKFFFLLVSTIVLLGMTACQPGNNDGSEITESALIGQWRIRSYFVEGSYHDEAVGEIWEFTQNHKLYESADYFGQWSLLKDQLTVISDVKPSETDIFHFTVRELTDSKLVLAGTGIDDTLITFCKP